MSNIKTYRAMQLIPFFIDRSVSPLKLQKLLYYSQVWHYVKTGRMLFSDDIKAWVYGPVIRDVWNRYKIMRRSDTIPNLPHFVPADGVTDSDTLNHLEEVWGAYGHLSGADLVDLTHSELPWTISRDGLLSDQPSDKSIIINDTTTAGFQLDAHGLIPQATSNRHTGFYQS